MNELLTLEDIDNIEDGAETELEYYESIQRAINSGSAWSMQGSYGRSMFDAIQGGYCMLGKRSFKDYYGNFIPSRDDICWGERGSYDYVKKLQGQEWADMMGDI